MHRKLKSREISFSANLLCSTLIFIIFCAEHDNNADILCVKFQNDRITIAGLTDEWNSARFELKMGFEEISYIAHSTEY